MDVTDKALLSSGFTPSDLQKIKNNVESYGGTLGNAIRDLARRFILAMWVVSGCLAVFIFLVIFASQESIFSGAIGNFIDRLKLGYVVDFFYFKLINFPIFNVADIYVTTATALLFVVLCFYYKEEELDIFRFFLLYIFLLIHLKF